MVVCLTCMDGMWPALATGTARPLPRRISVGAILTRFGTRRVNLNIFNLFRYTAISRQASDYSQEHFPSASECISVPNHSFIRTKSCSQAESELFVIRKSSRRISNRFSILNEVPRVTVTAISNALAENPPSLNDKKNREQMFLLFSIE